MADVCIAGLWKVGPGHLLSLSPYKSGIGYGILCQRHPKRPKMPIGGGGGFRAVLNVGSGTCHRTPELV